MMVPREGSWGRHSCLPEPRQTRMSVSRTRRRSMSLEQMQRWRLILGKSAEDEFQSCAKQAGWLREGCLLSGDLTAIDEALELVYSCEEGAGSQSLDLTREEWERTP